MCLDKNINYSPFNMGEAAVLYGSTGINEQRVSTSMRCLEGSKLICPSLVASVVSLDNAKVTVW